MSVHSHQILRVVKNKWKQLFQCIHIHYACLFVSLGSVSLWTTERISERSLPEDRQTWKSVEVKSKVCQCAVAVRFAENPQGWVPTYYIIERNTSIPTVPEKDITAPIDNHHIGANSPPISVIGLNDELSANQSKTC